MPGESQGWESLVACCLWGCTESDTRSDLAAAAAAATEGGKLVCSRKGKVVAYGYGVWEKRANDSNYESFWP